MHQFERLRARLQKLQREQSLVNLIGTLESRSLCTQEKIELLERVFEAGSQGAMSGREMRQLTKATMTGGIYGKKR